MEEWHLGIPLLTDWRRTTWQAETGGSWGLRLAGAERGRERRVNYGWTDKVMEGGGGATGEGFCPADRQAACWWSHLAVQSQPEMMGPSLRLQCTVALVSPKGLWDVGNRTPSRRVKPSALL